MSELTKNMENKKQKINSSADILKFIMSVLVVATHCSVFNGRLTPLFRLAVPVFFVLSGYFFFSRINALEDKTAQRAYLKKSVRSNLRLYLFWFILLLPITLYIRDYISLGVLRGGLSFLRDLLFASTFQSSWYIMALIMGLCVLYPLSRKMGDKALLALGAFCYIPALLSSNYAFITESVSFLSLASETLSKAFELPCRNVFAAIIYLVIGKILASEQKPSSKKKSITGFAVCFLLTSAEYLILKLYNVKTPETDCFVFLPLAAFYLCRFALSCELYTPKGITLRKISTVSYCLHMAVFMVVSKIFSLTDIPDWNNLLLFIICLLLTHMGANVIISLSRLKAFSFLKYAY